MRISDWSSDVCSSDLRRRSAPAPAPLRRSRSPPPGCHGPARRSAARAGPARAARRVQDPLRSEEHTSELQSLMRISYAVFCVKKKKEENTASRMQQKTTVIAYKNTRNEHENTVVEPLVR